MLAGLFAVDATYLHSPYAEPVVGLVRIGEMWEADRQGPDEVFTMSTEIVALDGDVAVVRALVRYGAPVRQEYTDLWIVRFDATGRCSVVRGVAVLAEAPLVRQGRMTAPGTRPRPDGPGARVSDRRGPAGLELRGQAGFELRGPSPPAVP